MKFGGATIVVVATLLAVTGCEDRTIINNNHGTGTQVRISGTLKSVWCPWGFDQYRLFDDMTDGDSAKITFTRLNGLAYAFYTDSASSFDRVLDEGPYQVTIESRWTLPDTSTIYLENDTTFDLYTFMWMNNPDTLFVRFSYQSPDTLGAQWEWDRIRGANASIDFKLMISGAVPPPEILSARRVYVYDSSATIDWHLSIQPQYHLYYVTEALNRYLINHSTDELEMRSWPAGYFICPG